jgi:hypothetical protein
LRSAFCIMPRAGVVFYRGFSSPDSSNVVEDALRLIKWQDGPRLEDKMDGAATGASQ